MCTILGTRGAQNLFNLPIDKLLARWYNGSSARLGVGGPPFYYTFLNLSIGNFTQKKRGENPLIFLLKTFCFGRDYNLIAGTKAKTISIVIKFLESNGKAEISKPICHYL